MSAAVCAIVAGRIRRQIGKTRIFPRFAPGISHVFKLRSAHAHPTLSDPDRRDGARGVPR